MANSSFFTPSKRLDQFRHYLLKRSWPTATMPAQLAETLCKSEQYNSSHKPKRVYLGSSARLFALDTREESTITLTLPGQSAPEQGRVSFISPLGLELLGRKTGDRFFVDLFGRRMGFIVLHVSTPLKNADTAP